MRYTHVNPKIKPYIYITIYIYTIYIYKTKYIYIYIYINTLFTYKGLVKLIFFWPIFLQALANPVCVLNDLH